MHFFSFNILSQVYKMHLVEGRAAAGAAATDSARANLASSFVNGFVNAGFGVDKLMTAPMEEAAGSVHWIFKNKVGAVPSWVPSLRNNPARYNRETRVW